MTPTWRTDATPTIGIIGLRGWFRAAVRGSALGAVTFSGLALLLLLRLFEAPLYGLHRPWTPWVTQFVCRSALVILGIRHVIAGRQMTERGAVVANHSSWLDIFALNARKRVYFVSKAEVADWPTIGWLARATGTVFIRRDPRAAKEQQKLFEDRLKAGHKLLFFPEGTSTDGQRVLGFKTTLFAAFCGEELRDLLHVQPVTVVWYAAEGEDPRFYGWWGDMSFAEHLLKVLSRSKRGAVKITYHEPLRVADFKDRKSLAAACERSVRSAFPFDASE